ncbi:MAG TPA: hypothetical protein VFA21_15555 [Pyrinomonadaceae bacterium]|nr:hypothetical protein [Pyrinomonadaceae bacterium]
MKFPIRLRLSKALLPGALSLAMLLLPATRGVAATRTRQELKVDVHVTVHNSDIGVSQEKLDELVEKLLEEAHFQVEKEAADSAAIQIKIDIYREDGGHFKVDGDLEGPKEEVENGEEKEEKEAETQEQIDDMVEAIVHDFIHFIHHA